MIHKPVMPKEVLEALNPKPGEFFIDGTLGAGGHAELILKQLGDTGTLLAIDLDKSAVEAFKLKFPNGGTKKVIMQANFADLREILVEHGLGRADGLILDLGFSSDELERSGRGFTYQKDEPLLMTFSDKEAPVYEVLAHVSEKELADIISEFSDERYAARIAAEIKRTLRRKRISTTFELRDAVTRAVPKNYERGRIHPATRTFQALRVYANREYENLKKVLNDLPHILKKGGRAAVITFHSGEDRIVKHIFAGMAKRGALELINKKVITAGREEERSNPRSRSAKLRAAIMQANSERIGGKGP